ncbi:MAG: hypothetical protein ACRC37_06535 [Lentisphaeria bacterium]
MGLLDKMAKISSGEIVNNLANETVATTDSNNAMIEPILVSEEKKIDKNKSLNISKKAKSNNGALRPNSNASKLHSHLNQVGEDGLTMKDRIELEVREQAKKVKKIIFAACGAILLFCLLIFAVSRCSSSPRGQATKSVSPIVSSEEIRIFRSKSFALVRTDEFDSQLFLKQCDDLIKKYPSSRAQIEEVRERLQKNYPLKFN